MQDVTPGKIAFTKPTSSTDEAKEHLALFKPADLRESSVKLRAGDKVEFSLGQQDSLNEELATDVVLLPRVSSMETDGGQLKGCVISVKEGFGFIRSASLVMHITAIFSFFIFIVFCCTVCINIDEQRGHLCIGRLLLHLMHAVWTLDCLRLPIVCARVATYAAHYKYIRVQVSSMYLSAEAMQRISRECWALWAYMLQTSR